MLSYKQRQQTYQEISLAHLHIHTVGDRETSAPIIDPDDENLHWHTLGGNRTSSNGPLGGNHTHTIDGETTSPPIDRDSNKDLGRKQMKMEYATLSFEVKASEIKEQKIDGSNFGVFSGHMAAFAKDRQDDIFLPGAFQKSIARHKAIGRPIRMLSQHNSEHLVGAFPIESVREDEKGLFVVGNINLDVQKGRESFSLMKQGVLSDMSIGFSVNHKEGVEFIDGIRFLKEVQIWEGSLVTEPANPAATINEVKSVVPFHDLPLASRDRTWDSKAAVARIREFTDSTESPTDDYKKAFVFCDWKKRDEFSSYKLPIADIVNGKLVVVKDAVFAAAKALHANVPEVALKKATKHIERYCAKMGIDSPFADDDKQYFTSAQVKLWSPRDYEKALKQTGMFSKSALRILASKLDNKESPVDNINSKGLDDLLKQLQSFKQTLK